MLCIFCLTDKPPSLEHVFPRAIGGSLIIDRVCSDCNSLLGTSVDAILCDHVLITARRAQLQLRGYSGTVPDALRALGKGELESDPSKKFRVRLDLKTGKVDMRLLYHATETTIGDQTRRREITIDAKDADQIRKIVERETKRSGLPSLSEEKLQELESVFRNSAQVIENPRLRFQLKMDLKEFRFAIFKIAYELAFRWLGENYLADSTAVKLHEVLTSSVDPTAASIRGTTSVGAGLDFVRIWSNDTNGHIGYCSVLGPNVCICLRIFDVFSGMIVVSEGSHRYFPNIPDNLGMPFLHIDPVSGVMIECSLAEGIMRAHTSLTDFRG